MLDSALHTGTFLKNNLEKPTAHKSEVVGFSYGFI